MAAHFCIALRNLESMPSPFLVFLIDSWFSSLGTSRLAVQKQAGQWRKAGRMEGRNARRESSCLYIESSACPPRRTQVNGKKLAAMIGNETKPCVTVKESFPNYLLPTLCVSIPKQRACALPILMIPSLPRLDQEDSSQHPPAHSPFPAP